MKKLLFFMTLFLLGAGMSYAQNVAKIGSTEYPTLQDAIDYAITRVGETVTIDILRDFTEGPVDITQNPNINIVINGHDKTLTGQIFISSNQQESASSPDYITIDGLKFKYDPAHFANVVSGEDAFIEFCKKCRIWSSLNYSTNVTVKNCEFDGDGSNQSIYGVSSINTTYHLTVDNCTATNMLGLAEMQSATHFTVTNCTATNVKRGLWISGGGDGTSTIENNNITAEEYVVKLENQTGYAHSFNFANNTMSTENGQVFILNNITNPSAIVNVTSGTYYGDMDLSGIDADAHLNITGGNYSIDVTGEPCAPGYAAFPNGTNPETWEVTKAWFLYYDKNEASAEGTMDTIFVKQSGSATDRTVEVAACDFTWLPTHTFDEWNTKADGTGTPVAVGTNIELTSDTTLYVIWKVGYTIFYDANGGTGTIPYQSKDPGVDLTLSDGTDGAGNYLITKTDSTLYRWNTTPDEAMGSTDYALGGTYSADANDTLYAVWRLNLDMTTSATDVVCYHENNGTDTVKMIGGEAPFQLVLKSSVLPENDTVKNIMERTYIFQNLKKGDYTVELSDVLKKDYIINNFTIDEPDTLEITALTVPTNKPCPLMGVGLFDASVTAQGGNDPGNYTYTWGDDAEDVNADATVVPAKADDIDYTYTVTVTVTDIKACTATATATIEVSPVIVHIDSLHGNTTMKIDTIRQGVMQGCDTIIRDFGYPTFTFSNPAITVDILDTVYNDIPVNFPDSVFPVETSKIIWTAVDTCGHIVTCEQVLILYYYPCPDAELDSYTYHSVRVGCNCWLSENLRAKKYSDGRDIDNVMTYVNDAYPDETANANTYGYLYDWYAAVDTVTNSTATIIEKDNQGKRVQGACPENWYLPNEADLDDLFSIDTRDLRSTDLWIVPGGTNATGFNAIPSGYFNCTTGRFEELTGGSAYWSCHPVVDKATGAIIGYECNKITKNNNMEKCNGLSIRCILITDPQN